ncbi:hypothetical protein RJ640_019042 [Escallonia rubra]|uniref:Uncharacterized protein n=1 Tax=Escallonia rubra TaxID=112253 RepID=A0AA88QBZ9_9ASTE|nr:hypothetical protein RJ640_019042 [Escallonia rubra]
MASEATVELESRCLVNLCIEAASQSRAAVEKWRRQRRSLERLPSQLGELLFHRLLRRRLLNPSLLEIFKHSMERIDLRGESYVDAEWMAYIGAYPYLQSLSVADCPKISSSSLWPITGMTSLTELDLSRCSKVTDSGIRHLFSIPTLEKLCISETGVTANGVTLLSSLTNLSLLDLGGLRVTDVALSCLQVLKKLQYLDLWGSEITNNGATVLKLFPKLSFLNLAWTKVTKLPNLSSLACLNMSNCSLLSIYEGRGDKGHLAELILTGATFLDVDEAFLHVDTSLLSFLDLSNSSVQSFWFLPSMCVLEHLDLSGSAMADESAEIIARIGANLRFLNLSNTRVSSAGVGILAGHVSNLETISLSCTPIDDLAVSYLSMMPSLRVINLSNTNVRGLIQQIGAEPDWVPSLAALQNLRFLERLDMEEIQVGDAALEPLSTFQGLRYLSVKSGFLTDMSFHHFSSVQELISLSIRDAVLTNAWLDSFHPPSTLKLLDLRGCWLLTEDVLLAFCHKHPEIQMRHELIHALPSDQDRSKHPSPRRATPRTSRWKQQQAKVSMLPLGPVKDSFIDQRLKYRREELLSLQFSSTLLVPVGSVPPELQME